MHGGHDLFALEWFDPHGTIDEQSKHWLVSRQDADLALDGLRDDDGRVA